VQHDRPEDAVEENAVLVGRGDRECAEDQRPDEHVVERERELEHVSGEVLTGGGGALEQAEHDPEGHADCKKTDA
jgi:hypothetical protein